MYPTKKSPKISKEFRCAFCDYVCCKQSEFNRHVSTLKHKNLQKPNFIQQYDKKYDCICGKAYSHSSTLYAHRKKCIVIHKEPVMDETINDELLEKEKQQKNTDALIQYLMKENAEFKQLLIDQNKQMIELAKNAGNHNTNNSHNNFNLNLFLNETCKNALNIMDFVNQLQVGVKELEETGRLGFTDGISKIFIDGLKELDINYRPVHCSDFKREILYIKSDNQWNKESDDKPILTNAIKHVVSKNMKQISEWTKVHPEYTNSDSKQNDKYLQIVCESMSWSTEEECKKNYNKIIKNIVKEAVIDKK